MQTGFFEKQIVLTPDLCGSAAALSPLAAFTIFQGVASEHAEKIGVGGAAMAKRGEFWLTVHSRVDFYGPAYLMDELTARTWPERCEGRDIRCFRSYRLTKGEQIVALGRTQWAILAAAFRQLPLTSRPCASAMNWRRTILSTRILSVRRTLTWGGI